MENFNKVRKDVPSLLLVGGDSSDSGTVRPRSRGGRLLRSRIRQRWSPCMVTDGRRCQERMNTAFPMKRGPRISCGISQARQPTVVRAKRPIGRSVPSFDGSDAPSASRGGLNIVQQRTDSHTVRSGTVFDATVDRDREPERAAAPHGAFRPDPAAMVLHDLAGNA